MQPAVQTYSQIYDELEKRYLILNLKDVIRKSLKFIKPRLDKDIIEFAEEYIVLPPWFPIPGPFRIKNSPHLKEILRACVDPEVRKVTLMGCSQFGKTLVYIIVWAYNVVYNTGTALIGFPTDDDVKDFALQKLWPIIEHSPKLRSIIFKRKKGGTDDSSIRNILYPGGWTKIINLTSKSKTRMRTARDTYADDIDALEKIVSSEGDHLSNLEKRTTTHKDDSFNLNASVPHISGSSNIEFDFKLSSQEYYHITCPYCKKEQMLDDDNMQWDKEKMDLMGYEVEHKPETAKVSCNGCGHQFTERERIEILQPGVYIPKHPKRKIHRGFHLNQCSSTLTSLENIAKEKIKAEAALAMGDDEKYESYVNGVKGLPYKKIIATETDAKILIDRREDYMDPNNPKIIPNGVLLLTGFVDAQAGSQLKPARFEYEMWGWGFAEECWIVDKGVIEGSPEENGTRKRLRDRLLGLSYVRKDGLEMHIKRIGFDSGFASQSIYELCERMAPKGWYCTKGSNRYGAHLLPRKVSLVNKNKTVLLNVGSQAAKSVLFERLNTVIEPGAKRIHHTKLFCDVEYFDQLTAEHAIQKPVGLTQILVYDKKKPGLANEAIDIWCGAYVMMKSLNVNWKKFKASVDEKVGALSNEQLTGEELQQGKVVSSKEVKSLSPVIHIHPELVPGSQSKPAVKQNKMKKVNRHKVNQITNY